MMAYAGIRRGRNLVLGMLKNFVRMRTYGLYARHTLTTQELYQRYATRDGTHRLNTVSIRTINFVFSRVICAYENEFTNFHT